MVDSSNRNYSSDNGVLFDKNKTTLVCYPAGKGDDKYFVPNSVTSIENAAFRYCTSLTNITIPNSVTSIGDDAFYYCASLTNITIPDSVTSIGDYAFYCCTSLTNITIPSSVTSIGYYAFSFCDSLKIVNYSGAESDWNDIDIGYGNEDLINATKNFGYKIDPKITVTDDEISTDLGETLIVAGYDENNCLIFFEKTDSGSINRENLKDCYRLKAFVWDMENLRPLCNYAIAK